MTTCIGIHSARLLAGNGVAPVYARHILVSEFQLTTPQADAAVEAAYELEAHPAEVGWEPSGRGRNVNLHVHGDHTIRTHDDRVEVHF